MAHSAANWSNMHTHADHTHSLTHLHQQLQPRGAKRQLSYYVIWNKPFTLMVPEGGGENRSTRRKTQQPAR